MSDPNSEGYGGLFRIIKPVNRYIYSAMGLAALGSMATISTLLMLCLLVAVLIQGKECLLFCGISWTKTHAVAWVCLSGVLVFCLTIAGFGVSHLAAFNLEKDLRIRLSKHLARLPLGFRVMEFLKYTNMAPDFCPYSTHGRPWHGKRSCRAKSH